MTTFVVKLAFMARPIIYLFLIVCLVSCRLTNSGDEGINTKMVTNNMTPDQAASSLAEITFENLVFDFGKITQGEKREFTFKFTNTGEAPLILSSVKPSCGCTITKDWPKDPILPGGKGEIEVEFNSETKKGVQSKSITLIANTTPATTLLLLEGEVLAPNLNDNND